MISIVSNYHESITAECFNYTPCRGKQKANNAANHTRTHIRTHTFFYHDENLPMTSIGFTLNAWYFLSSNYNFIKTLFSMCIKLI